MIGGRDRSLRLGVLLICALAAGCGGSAGGQASVVPPSAHATPAGPANPVGLIAMGHSGLTGEGTSAEGGANYAGSWATGTMPDVNSVYLRLVAVRPETKERVANKAVGGARAAELRTQATAALGEVPVPALAIIQTVDQDIQCEPDDADAVAASVAEALQAIHTASPNTKILVVGQAGRPSATFIQALVAAHPDVKADMMGDDPCAFYKPDGTLNEAGIAKLTASIDTYEAAVAKACAAVPGCVTDGGVRRSWVDRLELFSADLNHLDVQGQAAVAEQLWPVVETLLGL